MGRNGPGRPRRTETMPKPESEMPDRRGVLVGGLGALLLALAPAAAQQPQPAKLRRLGILTPADSDRTAIFAALREGLREHGYVEGDSIVLEFRLARGDYGAIPRLAAELASLPVDVILTDGGAPVAHAAMQATSSIPIVMGTSGDPVMSGLVASLARPGRNVTGFTLVPSELSVKRLDLLRTAFPKARSVTVFLNPTNRGSEEAFLRVKEAAASLGLGIARAEAESPAALRALRPDRLDGTAPVLVMPDAMLWNNRRDLIALMAAARVPALYPEREYADDGGLMAYGPNVPDIFRRAAGYIDRILKGANPGELPIQQPTKFDFVVNLKTAHALGLTLPPTFVARADEVIE